MTMPSIRRRLLFRIFSVAVIAGMIAIGGIIAPLHHHDDFQTHDDCQLCLVSHQPVADSPIVQFEPLAAVIVDYDSVPKSFVRQYAQSFFSSRAPPSLLCSNG